MIDGWRIVVGAVAVAGAVGAYARWRIAARRGVWIAAISGGAVGIAITLLWGARPALAAALVLLGMVAETLGRRGLVARGIGLGLAYALVPAIGLCGVVLLAWGPRSGRLHWAMLAIGLAIIAAIRIREADPIGPLTVAEVVLSLSAGALASRPLGRWVISAGPRLATYVALLLLPALALLGFAWASDDRLFAPDEVGRALLLGGGVMLGGAALALAGLGLLTILSTREPVKPELAGLIAVPPLLALAEGWSALSLAFLPVALALVVGGLLLMAEMREDPRRPELARAQSPATGDPVPDADA